MGSTMSNNQATIEDLIDEMYDLLDKGWKMPLSAGKMFVDGEEVRQILDEIKEESDSKTYLLVAHNGIARVVRSYFQDMTNEEYAKYGIGNCEVLQLV